MKMNEEEGPGEYDHTEELVKAWKEAVFRQLINAAQPRKASTEYVFTGFHGKH